MADGLLRILLGLDAHEVNAARKDVGELAKDLAGLGNANTTIGGIDRDAAILKQMSMDITRLASISRTGESKGGVLDLQQWKDAQQLSKKVGDNLGAWVTQSQQLRSELAKLNKDLQDIQRASLNTNLSAGDRDSLLEQAEQLKNRRSELENEIKGRSKGDARVDVMRERAQEYASNIKSFGTNAATDIGKSVQRALGLGLAAVGGFSVLSLLAQSRAAYLQYAPVATRLTGKGVDSNTFGDGVPLGMSKTEYMSHQEQMIRATSSYSRTSNQLSAAFAKRYGLDEGEVAGMYAAGYKATGDSSTGDHMILAMRKALTGSIKETHLSEIMQMVSRNTGMTASAMGGAAITASQSNTAIAMAIEGMKTWIENPKLGTYAKSDQFGQTMQNMFQDAGTPAGNILLAQVAGVFDPAEGPWSWERKYKFDRLQQEGPWEHMDKFKKMLNSPFVPKSAEGAAGFFSSINKNFPKGEAGKNFIELARGGHLDDVTAFNKRIAAGEKPEDIIASMQKEYSKQGEAGRLIQTADNESTKIQAGGAINSIAMPLEKMVNDSAKTILNDKNVQGWIDAAAGVSKTIGNVVNSKPVQETVAFTGEHPGAAAAGGLAGYLGSKAAREYAKRIIEKKFKDSLKKKAMLALGGMAGGPVGWAMSAASAGLGMYEMAGLYNDVQADYEKSPYYNKSNGPLPHGTLANAAQSGLDKGFFVIDYLFTKLMDQFIPALSNAITKGTPYERTGKPVTQSHAATVKPK